MLKDGDMFDSKLNFKALGAVFLRVTFCKDLEFELVDGQLEEELDLELNFKEFQEVLARICRLVVVNAECPFEETLDNWLGMLFLPRYKRLLQKRASIANNKQ